MLFKGAGRAFCAGADIGEFKRRADAQDAGIHPTERVASGFPSLIQAASFRQAKHCRRPRLCAWASA